MRVWDVSAGYLDRARLLGEHRELHGIHVILSEGKSGYASHPETRRWDGRLDALACRHRQLVAEMQLRGYTDRTPLTVTERRCRWPRVFVTEPVEQFGLLRLKYSGASQGRIPLPRNAQQLWAQHKYSVMARSISDYQAIGRLVARHRRGAPMTDLALTLVAILRERPGRGRLTNALEHMWGHVRRHASAEETTGFARGPAAASLAVVQAVAMRFGEPYLVHSTALSELAAYC